MCACVFACTYICLLMCVRAGGSARECVYICVFLSLERVTMHTSQFLEWCPGGMWVKVVEKLFNWCDSCRCTQAGLPSPFLHFSVPHFPRMSHLLSISFTHLIIPSFLPTLHPSFYFSFNLFPTSFFFSFFACIFFCFIFIVSQEILLFIFVALFLSLLSSLASSCELLELNSPTCAR